MRRVKVTIYQVRSGSSTLASLPDLRMACSLLAMVREAEATADPSACPSAVITRKLIRFRIGSPRPSLHRLTTAAVRTIKVSPL